MIKFLSISRNTFVQTIRQPIYGVLILVTFAVLVLAVPLAGWTMGTDYHTTDQKMLENLGLSTLLIAGLLTAAFSASAVLSREIEDKTAMTVISKPVSRATFVLGKFAGVAAAVSVAFYLCGIVFLMTVRHKVMPAASDPFDWPVIVLGVSALGLTILTAMLGNLLFGWSFISSGVWSALVYLSAAMGLIAFIAKGWQLAPFGHDIRGQLLVAMALLLMAVFVLVAVAIAASTRLGQVMTLLVCIGVYIVGSVYPAVFERWEENFFVSQILGRIAPKLTYFYPLDALTMDKHIPMRFVALAGAYCALYVSAVLAIGIALFQRRELDAQPTSSSMPSLVGLLGWGGRASGLALGIIAGMILWQPGFRTPSGFAAAGALLAGAVALVILGGSFSRGAKWAYRLVSTAAAVALLAGAAILLAPGRSADAITALAPSLMPLLGRREFLLLVSAATAVAAAVLVMVVSPGTRHHFKSTDR